MQYYVCDPIYSGLREFSIPITSHSYHPKLRKHIHDLGLAKFGFYVAVHTLYEVSPDSSRQAKCITLDKKVAHGAL